METKNNDIETESKDPALWKIAQRRAGFKYHLLLYCIVNIFYWTIWYVNLRNNNIAPVEKGMVPWPVWPMFGWGIGIFFHYLGVYKSTSQLAEREYQKLLHKQ